MVNMTSDQKEQLVSAARDAVAAIAEGGAGVLALMARDAVAALVFDGYSVEHACNAVAQALEDWGTIFEDYDAFMPGNLADNAQPYAEMLANKEQAKA